jgi:hypothetical protein
MVHCDHLAGMIMNDNRVDYCGPTGFITSLAPRVKEVILLDHHKTAIELVDDLKTKSLLPLNCNQLAPFISPIPSTC